MLWVISCTTWVAVAEEPATHVPPPQMQQAVAGKIPFASVSVPYVSQSSGLVYPLTQPYPAVVIQPAWSVHSQAAVGAATVGAAVGAATVVAAVDAATVGAAVGAEATHVPPPQMQHALAGSTPLASASAPYVSQSAELVYPVVQV